MQATKEFAMTIEALTEVPASSRICGSCEETKDLTEFYKDGTDPEGIVRYRRDCKECYKITRMQSAKAKAKAKGGKR